MNKSTVNRTTKEINVNTEIDRSKRQSARASLDAYGPRADPQRDPEAAAARQRPRIQGPGVMTGQDASSLEPPPQRGLFHLDTSQESHALARPATRWQRPSCCPAAFYFQMARGHTIWIGWTLSNQRSALDRVATRRGRRRPTQPRPAATRRRRRKITDPPGLEASGAWRAISRAA